MACSNDTVYSSIYALNNCVQYECKMKATYVERLNILCKCTVVVSTYTAHLMGFYSFEQFRSSERNIILNYTSIYIDYFHKVYVYTLGICI